MDECHIRPKCTGNCTALPFRDLQSNSASASASNSVWSQRERNNYLRNCSPAWIGRYWTCCTHSRWILFHYFCFEKETAAKTAYWETLFRNGYPFVSCTTHDSKLFHGISRPKRCLLRSPYIAEEHLQYHRFYWQGRLYQYTCIPNGLSSAPRCFTKLVSGQRDQTAFPEI